MKTAVEVVKDVYDCFARSDLEGFLALCGDDIEWIVNGPASLEKCNAFKGRSGVKTFLAILARNWEFSAFTPRQFFGAGQTVVVLGEESGKIRMSGVEFENRWAHVFDVSDGQVVRFREYLCHWTGGEKPPVMS